MKKIIVILVLGILILTGCEEKNNEKIDYSKYSFTNVSWVRDSGHDIETIKFKSDGSFSYSCACGNSVNDADLCEKYTYNDDTKEIKLICFETTEDTITTIKIVVNTENLLKLDFNGEIRTFEKSE